MRRRSSERGFTLVEITIVVLVLAVLLASLLGPLSVRIEQQQIRKTLDHMQEIKEALYGYAMANGALPCPDTDADGNGDGLADQDTSTPPQCADPEGWLPFQTLGVPAGDAWGYRFRYRVIPAFTVPNINAADPAGDCAPGDGNLDLCGGGSDDLYITVQSRPYTLPHTPTVIGTAPAVILSHGKNGYGATRTSSTCIPPVSPGPPPGPDCMSSAPNNTDEQKNTDPSRTAFVSRHYTASSGPCDDDDNNAAYCEYDDIVVWISPNILRYRLVQAGRLP